MAPKTLPPELWSEIFAICESQTLYDVCLVCSVFQDLARKHLFRNLRWDRSHYAASPIWEEPQARNYPQTLVLTDLPPKLRYKHNVHEEYRRRMALAGVGHNPFHHATIPHPHFGDEMFTVDALRLTQLKSYQHIAGVITSFVNLTSIEFRHATMPNAILSVLDQFPLLESLSIVSGLFDASSVPVSPPPRLRELTIWRARETDQFSWASTFPQLLLNLLTPTLRTLRIDWTPAVAVLLSNSGTADALPAPDLAQLTTLAIRTPAGMSWVEGSPHFAMIPPLRALLRTLPNLASFTVSGGMPDIAELQASSLPNLRHVSGPASVAMRLCANLTSVALTDEWFVASQAASALAAMRKKDAGLKTIEIHLGSWDVEVLYAIAELFHEVEEVKIEYSYETARLDDAALISIGPNILERMTKIRSFHLYHMYDRRETSGGSSSSTIGTNADMFSSNTSPVDRTEVQRDEEVFDALSAWKRYCPTLVEVKLDRSGIWRRANKGDLWVKREHEVVEVFEHNEATNFD